MQDWGTATVFSRGHHQQGPSQEEPSQRVVDYAFVL